MTIPEVVEFLKVPASTIRLKIRRGEFSYRNREALPVKEERGRNALRQGLAASRHASGGMNALYFIQGQQTKLIKIGVSKDPMKRLEDHQTSSPDRLTLLGPFTPIRKNTYIEGLSATAYMGSGSVLRRVARLHQEPASSGAKSPTVSHCCWIEGGGVNLAKTQKEKKQ